MDETDQKEKEIIETDAPENTEAEVDSEQPETPEGSAAPDGSEQNATPTGRERWEQRLKEYDPEGDFGDDEKFYAGLDRYAEGRDAELGEWRDFNDRLKGNIEADPHSGLFLVNLLDGMDFVENLHEVLGPELKDIIESPESVEKHKALIKKAQEADAIRQANEEESQAVYEAWAEDKDTALLEQFGESFLNMVEELKEGKVSAGTLDALWKGFNYDEDIKEAEDTGEIRGRNERIMLQKAEREGGDGVPSLGSAAVGARTAKTQPARQGGGSIWDRGK